jgi:hypothetical protein
VCRESASSSLDVRTQFVAVQSVGRYATETKRRFVELLTRSKRAAQNHFLLPEREQNFVLVGVCRVQQELAGVS